MKNLTFNEYIKIYNSIIVESTLSKVKNNKIPSVSKKDALYLPILENEYIKALKNIIWIYDDDNLELLYDENIIYESPGSLDYPGELCDEILSINNNSENLTNKEVLSYINPDWKYYNELKEKGKTIKIFKFDFTNLDDIKKNFFMLNLDDDIKDAYINKLYKNSDSYGAFLAFPQDLYVFVFNKSKYTKKTIFHEFIHYLQYILDVEKIKVKNNLDKSKLDFLNLSKSSLNTIIEILEDELEIIPYINEFCEDVYNVFNEYQKKDEKLKWDNLFIEFFIKQLMNSKNIRNEKFFKLYEKFNQDMTPLYVVIGCFVYDIELEKIKKIMYEENKIPQ